MKKLLLVILNLLAGISLAHAQTVPAQMGITPATVPEVLQVLDNTQTWVPIGVVNPNHTFTSSSSAQTNLRFVTNVTQPPYNADPSGATDSTAAINAALAVTGTCTYFPMGTYYVTGELDAPAHGGCIFGDGPLSTNIVVYNSQSGKTNFNIGQLAVATASFLTGTTTISVVGCPTGLTVGGNIYDTANWTWIGTIASCIGTTLQLQAGAYADSKTAADNLMLGGAGGVFVLPPNTGGNGDLVRDIGFDFIQPQTNVRANIVPFPPAIRMKDSGRHRIQNVRINDSNICLDTRSISSLGNPPTYTTSGGGGVYIDNVECAALTIGMQWDGAKDAVHWNGFHFWNFGNLLSGSSLLSQVMADGNTICFQNGRIDSLTATNTACFEGHANFTANAGSLASGAVVVQNFTGLGLDKNSVLNVAGGNINIANGYSAANIQPAIIVTGGQSEVKMVNWKFSPANNTGVAITVLNQGKLFMSQSKITCSGNNVQCATVNNGYLDFSNDIFTSAGTFTATPLIEQSGTGFLQFSDNVMYTPGPNVVVQFDTDTAFNYLGVNTLNGWTVNYPPTVTSGLYRSTLGGWRAANWTLNNPASVTSVTANSLDGSAAWFTVQDNSVNKWRIGNLGSATGDSFSIRDFANASSDFLRVTTGGSAAYGEGATNVHAFRGVFQTYTGDKPTASGTCPISTQNGGQIAGSFRANGACAGGTVILTFSATTNQGYTCDAHDQTTPADLINQTAYSTTSVTFTGTMANSDLVTWKCIGW